MPKTGFYIWEWFWELSQFRETCEGGYQPLSPQTIIDWSKATGISMNEFEFRTICKMDFEYRKAYSEEVSYSLKEMEREREKQWT